MAIKRQVVEYDIDDDGTIQSARLLPDEDAEIDVILYGAFHHVHSSNPRYKLHTDKGRFETIDESVSPNTFVDLDENNEPRWGSEYTGPCEVILTLDENNRVIGIRGRQPVPMAANGEAS